MYFWTADLETGNSAIDNQHKELIQTLNNLITACIKLKGSQEIENTINFLYDYTIKHFNMEESLQIQSNYPNYLNHKTIHNKFKNEFKKIIAEYKANPDDIQHVNSVSSMVGDWLVNHIKKEDVAFAKYYQQI